MKARCVIAAVFFAFVAITLQGCGGGGDSPTPSPTPAGNHTPAPAPAPTPAPSKKLKCSVCAHVYDPMKDCGGQDAPTKDCGNSGMPFEQLPADWKCPVCGQGKDKYQPETAKDGSVQWVEKPHDDGKEEEQTTLTCSVCQHIYDPKKDCGGKDAPTKDCGSSGTPFEQLPVDWKCPVCGQGKDKYHPAVVKDGSVQWVEKPHEEEKYSPMPQTCDQSALCKCIESSNPTNSSQACHTCCANDCKGTDLTCIHGREFFPGCKVVCPSQDESVVV